MNIPVPPFAKGGLGRIGFLSPLQFRLSIPPAPLLQRGVNIPGNRPISLQCFRPQSRHRFLGQTGGGGDGGILQQWQ